MPGEDFTVEFFIPGDPVAWKRPGRSKSGFRYDPPENRSRKAEIQTHILAELEKRGEYNLPLFLGPVILTIFVLFRRPKSSYRKRNPRGREPHTKRPDADNLTKLIKDSAEGIIYIEDKQVFDEHCRKFIAAQDEAPYTLITVAGIS